MLRSALDPLALFLSPFIVFAAYLALRARYPLAVEHWTRGRISALTLIGLFIAAAGMFFFGLNATRGQGVYIPAHIENGALVPGHIE